MFDFGLRLRDLRKKHNMSQEELGRRVNRSKSVICSYESNLKFPPLGVLTDIAAIFNVSLDYLVGFDKAEMISVETLSSPQKQLIRTIIDEFKSPSHSSDGLTPRQQQILGALMKEFAKK